MESITNFDYGGEVPILSRNNTTKPEEEYARTEQQKLIKQLKKIAKKRVKRFIDLTPEVQFKSIYTLRQYIDILLTPRAYSAKQQKKPLRVMRKYECCGN